MNVVLMKAKYKSYHKGCQKQLRQLKEDYYDQYRNVNVNSGTVIYEGRPVISTKNKEDWSYELKTTGSCCGGCFSVIENILSESLRIIRESNSDR